MRNELHDIEQIEKFLQGKLTATELAEFETRLKTDDNLCNNVILQEQLTERLRTNAFRNEIAAFHTQYATNPVKWSLKSIFLNSILALTVAGSLTAIVYYSLKGSAETQSNVVAEKTAADTPSPELLAQNIAKEETPSAATNTAVNVQTTINTSINNNPPAPLFTIHGGKLVSIETPVDETPCKNFILAFNTVIIDSEKDAVVTIKESGSTIYIPAGILIDKDGKKVKGNVEIRYREYRNPAQSAFSQLPMNYKENGIDHNMNSAGMFEIRAYQDGKELNIMPEKSFSVDYNVISAVDSLYFFALNDKTQEWKKLRSIDFPKNKAANNSSDVLNIDELKVEYSDSIIVDKRAPLVNGQLYIKVKNNYDAKVIKEVRFRIPEDNFAGNSYSSQWVDSGYYVLPLTSGKHDITIKHPSFKKLKMKNVTIYDKQITTIHATLAQKHHFDFLRRKKLHSNYHVVDSCKQVPMVDVMVQKSKTKINRKNVPNGALIKDNGNRTNNTLLAENINKGHTYPTLVKGLQCSSFGVYNCDQIMRVPDRLMVNATYQDKNGNTIQNGHVLSMIDLRYNGAFSFDPQNFSCSKSGRNVLLLFTSDNKLYALPESDYQKMNVNASGNYTFTMTDISNEVQDSEALKTYLGLK